MRILFASERPPYPFLLAGAARSTHLLLSALARDGSATCQALSSMEQGAPLGNPPPADHPALGIRSLTELNGGVQLDCGYPIELVPAFHASLERHIAEFKPDVVLSQLNGAGDVLEIARRKGVRGLYFLRDAEFDLAEVRRILGLGAQVICNSRFLSARVAQLTGVRPPVIHPSLQPLPGVTRDPAGWITLVNVASQKGGSLVLQVAALIPAERFLLQESWPLSEPVRVDLENLLARFPNVRFSRRVPDIGSILRQTRLLLVPSQWEESFGRVVLEAQSCGIPVIASDCGGVTEAVGEGGLLVKDFRDPAAWVAAIGKVLGDPTLCADLIAKGLRNAGKEEFTAAFGARLLLRCCTGVTQ